jgi:hypothetical protein
MGKFRLTHAATAATGFLEGFGPTGDFIRIFLFLILA